MKTAAKFLILIALIFFFSCEDGIMIVKCADCVLTEPVKTDLEMKLEEGYLGASTIIKVYEGNLDDSILYATTSISGTFATVEVTLNKKYTVTATYNRPGKTYVAIDATTPVVRYEKDQCDDPCYFVYDKKLDLRLKYIK